MKRMRARFNSRCAACSRIIEKGSEIKYDPSEREAFHANCGPTGPNGQWTREDREYHQGMREASDYLENKRLFGEAQAEQWEMERELRDPDGW